ncbi:glycosyltransferase family 4 protein [Rhizobium sp. YIM 134829]|uniref:glycosyltransferase family 4 protein n=1 Tax=Rhizobium sp. YIM 134829 TaxID=3390453 RepID=UPI0039790A1F
MAKPRIMIDGYNLALEKGTGIATYARNLAEEVKDLGHPVDLLYGVRTGGKSELLSEVGFFDPSGYKMTPASVIRQLTTSPLGTRAREIKLTGKVIARHLQGSLPEHDRIVNRANLFSFSRWHLRTFGQFLDVDYENRAQIAHWTYPMPVKMPKAANLYTIHDLVPLRLPYATLDNKREFMKVARRIAQKADHIVTVSDVSKVDIVNLLDVDESRVTNTYQAVRLPRKILDRDEDAVRDEVEMFFGLQAKKYFLFFGAIEPKKNIGRLIEAYLASQSPYPLIIVGQLVWKDNRELRLLDALVPEGDTGRLAPPRSTGRKKGGSIMRVDYLPFSLLTSMIRCARAVVFPSLYEGFGLPILEAMQLGTAVITGTEGANPEVAGDAALLVDPYDVQSIASGIRTLTYDDDMLAHYEQAGRARAELFSPERYAERLQALYAKFS